MSLYDWEDIRAFQVGMDVVVTRDDGTREVRKVKYFPWQLRDGTWVVGLTGISGGYRLDQCEIPEVTESDSCDP